MNGESTLRLTVAAVMGVAATGTMDVLAIVSRRLGLAMVGSGIGAIPDDPFPAPYSPDNLNRFASIFSTTSRVDPQHQPRV